MAPGTQSKRSSQPIHLPKRRAHGTKEIQKEKNGGFNFGAKVEAPYTIARDADRRHERRKMAEFIYYEKNPSTDKKCVVNRRL